MKPATHKLVFGGIALGLVAFACSYQPHPEDGKQRCHGPQRECPDGYVCQSDNRCWALGHGPLTAPGTGGSVVTPGTGGSVVVTPGAGGTVVITPGAGGTGIITRGTGGVITSGTGGNTTPGTGGIIVITPGTGGVGGIGTGGAVGLGGTSSTGGAVSRGGSIGSGGAIGSGGVVVASGGSAGGIAGGGTGGVIAVGGTVGTGGTTLANTGTVMTISGYQAHGAITGFAWIALAELDTVTDPLCKSPAGSLSSEGGCNNFGWSTPNAYCISGYIPAVSGDSDYAQNWGIQLGINATPAGDGLGQSFTAIAFSMTGTPAAKLRAVLHRKGDVGNATFCADITPGISVPFTSFNATCWDNLGKYLALSDVANLDQIGVQVPSGQTATTLTDFCLTGITFTK